MRVADIIADFEFWAESKFMVIPRSIAGVFIIDQNSIFIELSQGKEIAVFVFAPAY